MTITDDLRPRAFRIGRVLGDSFAVFGRNIGLSIGLAVIFSALPTFIYQWWLFSRTGIADPSDPAQFSVAGPMLSILGFAIYFVFASLLQAALTRVAIEDLNGEKPTFGDSLSTALGSVVAVLTIAILFSLGVGLGFILLIIPGIILWIRWSVSVPVRINEKLGALASMSRSAELIKGSRWQIFGLLIIVSVIVIALNMALGLLTMLLISTFGIVAGLVLSALLSTLSSIATSIVSAVSYVELRFVKEGADVKDLAEIFA